MGYREVAAVKKRYVQLRAAERSFRDALMRETINDRKQALKDLQDKFVGDRHMIEEAYGQKLAELSDQETAEIQAVN
jgi:uncharacterized protein